MSRFHINKQHQSRTFNFWVLLLVIPFIILATGGFMGAFWYQANLQPVSSSDQTEVVVQIEEGSTAKEIGRDLEARGIIKSGFAFELYTKLNGYRDSLQAGGYTFSPADSVQAIVSKIVNGEVASDLVIILPARRIDQVKSDLMQAGYTTEEINQAVKPSNYQNHPMYRYIPEEATLEGFIYPDSYQRTANTSVTDIITVALNELDEVLTPALEQRFAENGLTVYQAITLASIVEQESSASSGDRPTIAQVYLKRLAEGIPLQADPTAQYGTLFATGTTDGWRTYDTPYNTYLYPGLPIGPISNVSKSSLEAVAYPTDTDYLYFVADDTSDTSHFARTLAEHEQNIARYCQVKCASY